MASDMTWVGSLRAAREWATPTLKSSAFLEKGVLTPEEFVKAGDELVFRCPTWAWQAGTKSYLPSDKQFLITRNVPCQTRVAAMEEGLDLVGMNDGGEDSDWLVSSIKKENDNKNIEDEFDILDDEGEVVERKPPAEQNNTTTTSTDEYADMEDYYEDDNIISDDNIATEGQQDNLLKTRTYDLSITYDKYYQTPRVWMVGKSAQGQPLSGPEMMEDVMSDYANKTVTIEGHPHVSGPHASIHPCQHGKVMKTIVRNLIKLSEQNDNVEKNNEGPSVETYLFIFLKFVSSIIPTINYDFTMDVTASTH